MVRDGIPSIILLGVFMVVYVGCYYSLGLGSRCRYGCVHMYVRVYSISSLGYYGTYLVMV